MTDSQAALAVVVVTYRSAAVAPRNLARLFEQLDERDELLVVDNASNDGTADAIRTAVPRARILEQLRNLGFAAGCNIGAAASSAPLLLFLNPDAVPEPGCVESLRVAAAQRPDWGAWQALVTMPGGGHVNTSGGITHFSGIGWAGACGEPVTAVAAEPYEVSFASGAALVVRREAWERVGGFDERYFMYGEDLDLSLRLWLAGLKVGIVPSARVEHEYEFEKGGRKWFLLERNRWWTVLSDYPAALLALLAPALLGLELVILLAAARGGWLGQKLRAQLSVVLGLPAILARRRRVQRARTVGSAELARRLSADLSSPFLPPAARSGPAADLQRAYWAGVRWLLNAGGAGRGC
ncbi:MAG TPA: glycosyltransferase family 2 protein [Thermoleophilaceae bacterium]|nr:glycosyltransferase family 2 protein [Thermoleophilaceae bacterium]